MPISNTIPGGAGDESLPGTAADDFIDGAGGNDTLTGLVGDDSLSGGPGNDSLDGGVGADTMAGGAGNDTYVVDGVGDVVTEVPGEGTDTIRTNLSTYSLAATPDVENLVFTGAAAFTASGNAGNNTITGGAFSDLLEGGDGNDQLNGGGGNNTLSGGAGADIFTQGGGNDSIDGGIGNDILNAFNSSGAGLGLDTLSGGDGDDTLNVGNTFAIISGVPQPAPNWTFFGSTFDGGAGTDTLGVGGHVNLLATLNSIEAISLLPQSIGVPGAPNVYTAWLELHSAQISGLSATTNFKGVGQIDFDLDTGHTFNGSGFTFDAAANINIEINGGAGSDTIVGTSRADVIRGDNGDADFVSGSTATDSLSGGGGDDLIEGGWGSDTISGGVGNDIIHISAGQDRIVDFTLGQDRFDLTDYGFDSFAHLLPYLAQVGGDTVLSITLDGFTQTTTFQGVALASLSESNFIFAPASAPHDNGPFTDNADLVPGGAGPDTLNGAGGADTVMGFDGNDSIIGGAGHDSLDGGAGADTMAGGDGNDIYVVDNVGDVVIEVAGEGIDTIRTSLSSYSLAGTPEVENLTANAGLPAFTGAGNAGANTLTGSNGADSLAGAGGADSLNGANGADSLDGGAGNDTLNGGAGNDLLDGGDDNDVLSTGFGAGVDTLNGGAGDDTLNLNNLVTYPTAGAPPAFGTLPIATFAGVSINGGDGIDYLGVSSRVNFQGTISGIEGISFFAAGNFNLGNGTSVHFDAAELEIGSAVAAMLSPTTTFRGTGDVFVRMDTSHVFNASGFVYEAGSNVRLEVNGTSGDDTITGTNYADDIEGGGGDIDELPDGNNSINGGGGNDTLEGGEGDDTLTGGSGDDVFELGAGQNLITDFTIGQDRFNLSDYGFDSFAHLLPYLTEVNGSTVATITYNGVTHSTTFQGVPLASLSDSSFIFAPASQPHIDGEFTDNADLVPGGAGNDILSAGGGNDTVFGFGGDDSIAGGAGADSIDGGAGADTMAGGAGNDIYVVDDAGDIVTEAANEGADTVQATVSSYTLTANVETLVFTGSGAFAGTGNTAANLITGGADADSLNGDAGADTLVGAAGNDTLSGGAGADSLSGGNDDDTFLQDGSATAGFETFDGGAGTDTLRISSSEVGAQLSPFGLIINPAGLFNLTLNSIERVEFASVAGHVLNVTLQFSQVSAAGLSPTATLVGGAGADQLNLLAIAPGDYTLPNFTLTNWNTVLDGSAQSDVVSLVGRDNQDPNSTFRFNYHLHTAQTHDGIQALAGGAGDDVLTGGAGTDALNGNGGEDELSAGAGADTLNGGAGDDVLNGGAGKDVINGGLGFDQLDFFASDNTQGADADLATGIITNDGYGNSETMTGIEALGLGTRFVDHFYGDDLGNVLAGGTGDFVYGRGGDDIIFSIGAAAVSDGGAGTDTLRFANQRLVDLNNDGLGEIQIGTVGATASLALGMILNDGFGDSGQILNFENLAGTSLGDTLTGDSNANQLFGNEGADALDGGEGDDVLFGGEGNDSIQGGIGVDTATYLGHQAGYSVTNIAGGVQVVDTDLSDGDDGTDTLYGIEVLQFDDGVRSLGSGVNISPVVRAEGNSGATSFTFTVTRTGDVSEPLTLPYTVTPTGTDAVETNDLVGFSGGVLSGSVTFAAGAATATLTVPVVGDTTLEGSETFLLSLSQPAVGSVQFLNQTAVGTVLNDDAFVGGPGVGAPPTFSLPADWASAINHGDPHISTLDGLRYDMQGVGEFVMVQSTQGAPVMIQVRTEAVSAFASDIAGVATQVGSSRVSIDATRADAVWVDGHAFTFQPGEITKAVGDGAITKYTQGGVDGWLISYSNATKAAVVVLDMGDRLDVTFAASPDRHGEFKGLMGNFDGQAGNDLALRDGTPLSSTLTFDQFYSQFVSSWRISQAESLFDYAPGQSTATFTNTAFPPSAVDIDDFPTDLVAAAQAAVDAAGITDPGLRQAALTDYLLTGDATFITSGANAATTVGTVPATVAVTVTEAPAAPAAVGVGSANPIHDEGQSGATAFEFKIYRTDGAGVLNVNWNVAGANFQGVGGAANAADFTGSTQGTVTFAAGETEKTVVVNVAGDTTLEQNEGFEFTITAPAGTPVIANSIQTTILNDDGALNSAPTVSGVVTVAATEDGAPVSLDALAKASDVDAGTTLTVVAPPNLPAGVTYNAATHSFSLNPANAAYQHLAAGQSTTVSVGYGVSDGQATTPAVGSWTIAGANDAPVANADTAAVSENQSVTINVLGNDTDVDDGDSKTLFSVSTTTKGASVSIVAGKAVYVADAESFDFLTTGQSTTDTFSYVLKDAAGATSTASVTVTINGVADGQTQTGGVGADSLTGTALDEKIDGGVGNDTINAGAGADTVIGGVGNDSLAGGAGADNLSAGDGNDTLEGGAGSDVMSGARGNDTFVFGPSFGHDIIGDFTSGQDRIQFNGSVFASFTDVMAHASQSGTNVIITDLDGDTLQLNNVTLASLRQADFLFV